MSTMLRVALRVDAPRPHDGLQPVAAHAVRRDHRRDDEQRNSIAARRHDPRSRRRVIPADQVPRAGPLRGRLRRWFRHGLQELPRRWQVFADPRGGRHDVLRREGFNLVRGLGERRRHVGDRGEAFPRWRLDHRCAHARKRLSLVRRLHDLRHRLVVGRPWRRGPAGWIPWLGLRRRPLSAGPIGEWPVDVLGPPHRRRSAVGTAPRGSRRHQAGLRTCRGQPRRRRSARASRSPPAGDHRCRIAIAAGQRRRPERSP